jgi:hypothetical protein
MRGSVPSGDSSLLGCDFTSAVGRELSCVAKCRSAYCYGVHKSRYSSTAVRTSDRATLRHFLGPRTDNSYVPKRKLSPFPWNRTPVMQPVASYRLLSYTGFYYTCVITAVVLFTVCRLYICVCVSYRTANLQTLHFKYLFNKYPH